MGDFDGLEKAQVSSERLPFITPGRYVLEVEKFHMFDTRKVGRVFIGEYRVVKSEGAEARPEGERISHMIKKNDMFLGNIKTLVAAANNSPVSAAKASDAEALVSEKQPKKGTRIVAEAYQVMVGKNKDTPFTVVNYAPVAANGATKT